MVHVASAPRPLARPGTHRAAIVAAENVDGVKQIDDQLQIIAQPPPEEDYGGGDLVSLQEEASTTDDEPL